MSNSLAIQNTEMTAMLKFLVILIFILQCLQVLPSLLYGVRPQYRAQTQYTTGPREDKVLLSMRPIWSHRAAEGLHKPPHHTSTHYTRNKQRFP